MVTNNSNMIIITEKLNEDEENFKEYEIEMLEELCSHSETLKMFFVQNMLM